MNKLFLIAGLLLASNIFIFEKPIIDKKPFVWTCSSLKIPNIEKFQKYGVDLAKKLISENTNFADLYSVNFYEFSMKFIEKLNSTCYKRWKSQPLTKAEKVIFLFMIEFAISSYEMVKFDYNFDTKLFFFEKERNEYRKNYIIPQETSIMTENFLDQVSDQDLEFLHDLIKTEGEYP